MNNTNSQHGLSDAEFNALPYEQQLLVDPQRVLHNIWLEERAQTQQEDDDQWLEEIPQAQRIPEEEPLQFEEDFVDEDDESSISVNEHMEGHEYHADLAHVERQVERRSHRLPAQLLNVRKKYWFGTHNTENYLNIGELREQCERDPDIEYVCMFKEIAPTTGHIHYHSIVVLRSAKLAHSCFKLDPQGVWEPVRGQLKSAYIYVSKKGNKYFEYGELPQQLVALFEAQERAEMKRRAPTPADVKWHEMVERAKNGDQTIREERMYARHMAYFDQVLASVHNDVIYDGDLKDKNIWIHGPAGTGKSRMVWDMAKDTHSTVYVKNQNKWFDGYNGQKIVLIDDAGENMRALTSHLKNWGDRYPITAEVKGGTRRINTADFHLVVTSNYTIEQIFNATDVEAIKRRFEVFYLG